MENLSVYSTETETMLCKNYAASADSAINLHNNIAMQKLISAPRPMQPQLHNNLRARTQVADCTVGRPNSLRRQMRWMGRTVPLVLVSETGVG